MADVKDEAKEDAPADPPKPPKTPPRQEEAKPRSGGTYINGNLVEKPTKEG